MSGDALMDQIPEIYCDIMLASPDDPGRMIQELKAIGICPRKTGKHSVDSSQRLVIAKTGYRKTWYLDDALAYLFEKVDVVMPQLVRFIETYHVKAKINIAFWQYGTYPALCITGKNMEKIRLLQADIDIDPYDGSCSEREQALL